MQNDTIAAISTYPGESGIGIIRVSGENSIDIVNNLYINKKGNHTLSKYKSHTIHYGFISNSNEEIIDEVIVSIMKAPNSYTAEDVVEINCHGGIRVCRNILDTVINAGARIAEPGEFTKRAFLNGRLDLTRAEAVMDTIHAESDASLRSSINQLRGSLYVKLNNICSDILYEIAFIESALDDPDSISLDGYTEKLINKISTIKSDLNSLVSSYDEGRIISEGIKTVILGKPNAGKSSLLNALLEEDRAIVTNIPGTTRDTLTEKIRIGDITLLLTDTAGIRNTDDPIEHIGVNKAKESINNSDLIIYVCDSSIQTDEDDDLIFSLLKNKKLIILLNKCDLSKITDEKKLESHFEKCDLKPIKIINTSMNEKIGIDELKKEIIELFYSGNINNDENIIITNLRHVQLLKSSIASLDKVIESIDLGMSEDMYAIDLTDSYSSLAQITGAEVREDIVNEIFSKFCMGK